MTNAATFWNLYGVALEECAGEGLYSWPATQAADIAAKMRASWERGGASKDGPAFKRVCKKLKIPHTYKAINAFLAGESVAPPVRSVAIAMRNGNKSRAQCFGAFRETIDGQAFDLLVTADVNNGTGKCVTHKKSGKRVCAVGVGAAYLSSFQGARDDVARARVALQALIDKVGAPRVRSVIAAAE